MINLLFDDTKDNLQNFIKSSIICKNGIGNIDIHITNHCNLNCCCCDHFAPLADKWFADIKEYEKLLLRLKFILHDKQLYSISLMGGEPLLHPDIIQFCKISRNIFPDVNIKLVTNGILLKNKSEMFFKKLKEYNIEIYVSDYFDGKNFYKMNLLKEKKNNNVAYKYCNNRIHDVKFIQDNFDENMYGFFSEYPCVQLNMNGDFYSCIVPANIDKLNKYFNLYYETIKNKDYINIYDIEDIQPIIDMNNKEKIPFCDYCSKKEIVKWGITEHNIKEWMKDE